MALLVTLVDYLSHRVWETDVDQVGAAASKRYSRRKVISLTSVGMVLFLAACRSPAPSEGSTTASGGAPVATEAPREAAKTTLTYVHFFTPGDPQTVILPHAQELFTKQFPQVTIRAEFSPAGSALETKLETMIAGGSPPEVATINPQVVLPLISKGTLVDLSPYIQQDAATFDPENFYKPTLTRVILDGKQYGVPLQMGLFVLVYNKTLFDAAGVPYPKNGWSWDREFLAACAKLTQGTGASKKFGTVLPPLEIAIWANGGDVFSPDGKECMLDQLAAHQAVQWMADLRFKYEVAPTAADLSTLNVTELFLAGRLAMDIDITGTVSRIARAKPKFAWDLAEVPKGKAGRFTIVQGPSMVAFQGSKSRDLGWKWIEVYTGKSVQLFGATVAQVVSARKSADEAYLKLPPPPEHRGP